MSPLQILHEQIHPKAIVITIIGQMDESNVDSHAPKIYEFIEKLPQKGSLILNLSGLEYMNSKSIGYTTDFFNKITEKEGTFIIAEAQEQIVDILNVVGLTQVIPMMHTLKEAKEMILGEEELIQDESQEIPVTMDTEEKISSLPQKEAFSSIAEEVMTHRESKMQKAEGQTEESPAVSEDKNEEIDIQSFNKEPENVENQASVDTKFSLEPEDSVQEVEEDVLKNTQEEIDFKEDQKEEKQENTFSPQTQEEEGGFPFLVVAIIVSVIIILAAVFI